MINKIKSLISVDPGSIQAGIAFFQDEKLIESEQLKLSGEGFYNHLRGLKSSVERFLSKYGNVDYFAIETPYFGRNPQVGLKLGQARGIILALAFDYNVKIIDISPQETRSYYGVKGNAKKEDYQKIVKLENINKSFGEDEADAIAVGFTAISKIKNARFLASS
jgi:crossover junction endodeoxyribonuclease RuvC